MPSRRRRFHPQRSRHPRSPAAHRSPPAGLARPSSGDLPDAVDRHRFVVARPRRHRRDHHLEWPRAAGPELKSDPERDAEGHPGLDVDDLVGWRRAGQHRLAERAPPGATPARCPPRRTTPLRPSDAAPPASPDLAGSVQWTMLPPATCTSRRISDPSGARRSCAAAIRRVCQAMRRLWTKPHRTGISASAAWPNYCTRRIDKGQANSRRMGNARLAAEFLRRASASPKYA